MRPHRLALVVTAAALALTACSGGEGVDVGDSASGGGGTQLVAAIAAEPDQLDPHKSSAYATFQVLENVYDTLVQPNADLEMEPALAESWTTSDDQLTWTFTLRDGVTFTDGAPLTAEDVAYSYNRIIDEKLSPAWRLGSVESVTAQDDTTVVVTLTQPAPNLLAQLGGYKGMAIVQKANVDSGDIATKPIGTGPFSVESYTAGDSIVLTANPNWWGGAPTLDSVKFTFVPEPTTALANLTSGEVHWTDNLPPQQVTSLEGDDQLTLGVVPSNDYWYFAANQAKEPYSDVRVRQALAWGIDREAITEAAKFGLATVNQTAIPETSTWFYDYAPYSRDVDKAKKLLADAGVSNLTVDLMVTSEYPETVQAAQVMASQLAEIGVTVKIRTEDFATWLDDESKGKFDIFMLGWLGNIDPQDFYFAQHHTDGGSNYQKYSNAEVDALLEKGAVETDPAARKQHYDQATKIIVDEASYTYLYNPDVVQAWSSKLAGYTARGDRAIRFASASLNE